MFPISEYVMASEVRFVQERVSRGWGSRPHRGRVVRGHRVPRRPHLVLPRPRRRPSLAA